MAITLFNHLSAIFENQSIAYFDELSESDRKTYSTYMINRLVSMNIKYLPIVNEFQRYPIGARESYLFYSQCIPKKRQFNKYVKSTSESKYESWLVELIARYHEVSNHHAIEYLELMMLTERGKQCIVGICEFYGTDPKNIKKLKL